jgi:hypothetical protein
VPAFRLLRVGVKLFIRPTGFRCYQEHPVFFGEKCLARPSEKGPGIARQQAAKNQLTTAVLR